MYYLCRYCVFTLDGRVRGKRFELYMSNRLLYTVTRMNSFSMALRVKGINQSHSSPPFVNLESLKSPDGFYQFLLNEIIKQRSIIKMEHKRKFPWHFPEGTTSNCLRIYDSQARRLNRRRIPLKVHTILYYGMIIFFCSSFYQIHRVICLCSTFCKNFYIITVIIKCDPVPQTRLGKIDRSFSRFTIRSAANVLF